MEITYGEGDHVFQIKYRHDSDDYWNYIIKSKILELQARKTFVRMIFVDNSVFDIQMSEVTNQGEWSNDPLGVQKAIMDISGWIEASRKLF